MSYKDYVEINETFQYSINLQFDINNINKIKEYIPTKDSCEMMGYYLDSILGNFNKSTTLIGPYGKGKSHLLLVLMTLLNDYNEEDQDILNDLINKIKKIDEEIYEKIRKIRDAKLKYMPVIINSNYNNMNQAFLLALTEALEREKINDLVINTYFDTALKTLEKWENDGYTEAINKFKEYLKQYNSTIEELKIKLRLYDENGYKIFKSVYSLLMHGMEFNPLINTDIVKCYKEINYKINEYGYNGMLIVFDEFSKFLEYIGNESMMRDLKILQDFAELASRTGKVEQIIFTCITHKTINEYIKNLKEDKVNAFKTVEGRFKEIYFTRSMEQNYEMVSQTIKKKDNFEQMINQKINDKKQFYKDLQNEFSFCRLENNDKILFKGCYPLNPVTVYAVTSLSERVAQNERTLFTFLTDDDISSLKYFINNYNEEDLFNVDRIYDYFKNILRKENDERIKQTWIKSESAISKTQDENEIKILKTLAIIYMIDDFNDLNPNYNTLRLSLNMDEKVYAKTINSLMEKGIIKKKKTKNIYDFSTVYNKEVVKEIEKYVNTRFSTINEKQTLNKIADQGYVIPRRYNQSYKMIRFFKILFITEEEILNLKSFKLLQEENFSDGIVFYLIRKSKDIQNIKEKMSLICNDKSILRIPKEILSEDLFQALKEYEAIQYIKRTENNDEEIIKELDLIEEENIEFVQNEIQKKFRINNIECDYYLGRDVKTKNLSGTISSICENVYNRTPIINNEMINKNEITAQISKARDIVIDEILNQDKQLIKSETSAEATIYKAVVGKKQNEDVTRIIEIIKDYIREVEKVDKKDFKELYDILTNKPFGIRKGVIPILISIAIKEYSENIVLYYQKKEVEVDSNNISKIVEEPEKYYIYVQKGTEQKIEFIKKLSHIFGVECTDNHRNNIRNLVDKMKRWVLSLPRITRELSNINTIIKNESFIKIKNQLLRADINNNEFLFKTTEELFKTENYDEIVNQFIVFKYSYDNYIRDYTEIIVNNFKEKFEHNSKSNLNSVLTNWYKKIDEKVKHTVIRMEIKQFFEYIENISTYDDSEIIRNISYILLGIYLEDWQDNTYDEFFSEVEKVLDEIKQVDIQDYSDEQMVIISDGKKEIKKYINISEISLLGNTLKNNIEDSLDEYGDSISESEKIKILLEIIRKYM